MVGGDGIEPPTSTELTDTVDEVGPQIAIAVEAIQPRFAARHGPSGSRAAVKTQIRSNDQIGTVRTNFGYCNLHILRLDREAELKHCACAAFGRCNCQYAVKMFAIASSMPRVASAF